MGNMSKLQGTGGPTPTGQLPCYFLPLLSHTHDPCRALNLFAFYIRNGCIGGAEPNTEHRAPAAMQYSDLSERLFRALLLLYPRSFRARFGAEMLAFFRARRNEARHQLGVRGMLRLW